MAEDLTTVQQALEHAQRRGQILAFEAALAQVPGAVFGDNDLCPLTHHFGDGIYMREMFIPAGTLLVGKIHKHAHPVFLVRGALRLYTEAGGVEDLRAPQAFMAPPGVKRAALALDDTVWITVHVTASRDLPTIEAELIAPSFAAYDAWRAALEGGPEGRALPEGEP